MSDPAAPRLIRDWLLCFGIAYLLLTAIANLAWPFIGDWVGPASLAAFAVLMTLYATCTSPGRRLGWRAYLLCGFLLPGAIFLFATIGYALPLSPDSYRIYETVVAGFGVKVRVEGSGQFSGALPLLVWWAGIVAAVTIAPALRELVRKPAVD